MLTSALSLCYYDMLFYKIGVGYNASELANLIGSQVVHVV